MSSKSPTGPNQWTEMKIDLIWQSSAILVLFRVFFCFIVNLINLNYIRIILSYCWLYGFFLIFTYGIENKHVNTNTPWLDAKVDWFDMNIHQATTTKSSAHTHTRVRRCAPLFLCYYRTHSMYNTIHCGIRFSSGNTFE